jgi:hypothetical protein
VTSSTRRRSASIRRIRAARRSSAASISSSTVSPAGPLYRLITLTDAADPDGDPVALTVEGVTQDEPLNGKADGNTSPDAKPGPAPNQVYLRAERSGQGNGRVYRIAFTGSDGQGGTCSGVAVVGVPHDKGKGKIPVDSGLVFVDL